KAEARATLERLRDARGDAHVRYAIAELQSDDAKAYLDALQQVAVLAPANLAVKTKLADALVRAGLADSAVRQLEESRRAPPPLPVEAKAALESLIQTLRAGNLVEARAAMQRLSH